jgi:hypothetical protein
MRIVSSIADCCQLLVLKIFPVSIKIFSADIESLQELYKEGMAKHVNQVEISTLINFNREMYTAFKSLVFALKDYLPEPEQADQFDDLAGFIR